jgi:RimJ/RimL family protein N-acetyltransferase
MNMAPIVNAVCNEDAPALALLLNKVIAGGGTTALEEPFDDERLASKYLTGPAVLCCFVAHDPIMPEPLGFQTLVQEEWLPDGWGDIGTFAQVGGNKRGIGSALFAATRDRAVQLGLVALNATIRADNAGGLAFYNKIGFEDYAIKRDVPLRCGQPVDRISKRYLL